MRLIFCLLVVCLFGCRQPGKIPENFDYGKIENSVYSNEYFNFQIPIPADWAVQSKEEILESRNSSKKLIKEKNKELGEAAEADISTATLLSVYKFRRDTIITEPNCSFMILAENLGIGSGISSGKEYLETLRNLLKKSKMQYQFDSDIAQKRIGDKPFDYLPVSIKENGVTVGQYYYSIIKRNFALTMIITYLSEEQKYQLEEIIHKIKFD